MQLTPRIFDRALLGIVQLDPDGMVAYANGAAARIFGVSSFDGVRFRDLLADAESRERLDEQLGLRRRGESAVYRLKVQRASDTKVVAVEVAGMPWFDGAGKIAGAFGIFRSLEISDLADQIHELNGSIREPKTLLRAAARAVRSLLPFDVMMVTRYEGNAQFANPFFTYRDEGEQGEIQSRRRWIALSEEQIRWTLTTEPKVIEDLEEFFSRPEWKSLKNDVTAKALLQDGIRSAVWILVRREGRLVGSLSLMSRQLRAYDASHARLLAELPLDRTVLVALHMQIEQEHDFRFGLLKDLLSCPNVKEVADLLARRLVKHYEWSHVGLFRVDYVAEQIKLQAQHHNPKSGRVLENFQQPFGRGVFRRVVESKKEVLEQDISALSEEDYVPGPLHARSGSEFCIPIFFEDEQRVRWLLNIEDAQEYAFAESDRKALLAIAQEVGRLLQRFSEIYFLKACFDATSDAIVVTDNHDQVKRANRAAARLLGVESERAVKGSFADIIERENADSPDVLSAETLGAPWECRIKTAHGQSIPVLLSGQPLPEQLGGKVFLAKDLRDIRRLEELEFLGAATYELDAQTQTPLGLAIAWLAKLEAALPKKHRDVVKDTLRELHTVRGAYDRLALYKKDVRTAPLVKVSLNLQRELEAVISRFPPPIQALVKLEPIGKGPFEVKGDTFLMSFVFETLLSYLTRFATVSRPIYARLHRRPRRLEVEFDGAIPTQAEPGDAEVARFPFEMWLAHDAVTSFLRKQGGRLNVDQDSKGSLLFRLNFNSARA